jgi:hypothetical protein
MWLAQFVCAPQFFKTPSGLCGHTVFLIGKANLFVIPVAGFFSFGWMFGLCWQQKPGV